MQEGEKLNDHFKSMKELTDKLAAIGSRITEEDQVVTLLGSLPVTYSTIVTALEARGDSAELTMDFVRQALLNEELKRSACADNPGSRNGDAGALTASHQSHGSGPRAEGCKQPGYNYKKNHHIHRKKAVTQYKGPQCYRCKRYGHLKRDCPSINGEKANLNSMNENRKDTHSDNMFVATIELSTSTDYACVSHTGSVTDWVIDSGASRHTPLKRLKKHFLSLQ
jgi:hypothetical protein